MDFSLGSLFENCKPLISLACMGWWELSNLFAGLLKLCGEKTEQHLQEALG
jgi:hypothetical protein